MRRAPCGRQGAAGEAEGLRRLPAKCVSRPDGGNVTSAGIIKSPDSITLGWTNPTDSIYAGGYSRSVSIATGQAFTDDDDNIYEGTKEPSDLAGKTLRPSIPPLSFKDPEGREIEDYGVIEWLSNNGFTQADIDALGNDAAATDKLYECFLLNCGFAAGCWSAPRIPHPRHRRCR